jgi:hypothetical protein
MGRNYMTQKYNQFFIITDIYIYNKKTRKPVLNYYCIYKNIKLEEIRTKN